ncbi:WAT1-related protein At2g39510-like [Nymphaea colorata]|nr:WAT1-related protein At2g39510-like [Nymphaea colorata]
MFPIIFVLESFARAHCLGAARSCTLRIFFFLVEVTAQIEEGREMGSSGCGAATKRFRPHILMVSTQLGYTFLYIITQDAFSQGLNPHVSVTYRNVAAFFVMLPFAYFLERKTRPNLTIVLFLELFVLSLIGVSLSPNMYFASLRYTSPTFVASMVNTIASMTFIIAVVTRMEKLDVTSRRGAAKVVGTVASLGGAMIMSLYKGQAIKRLWGALLSIPGTTVHEDWVKGSILTIASCFAWAVWFVMQASTLKRYPAQLSLTTWMSFFGAAQSAVYTAFIEQKPQAWMIGFNINFWAIIYGGVVISGLVTFVQLWCTEKKGPVFVTMFNPLCTVLVALTAYALLGQDLNTGSVVGGTIVIVGLYLVLWGKEEDQQANDEELLPQFDSKLPASTKNGHMQEQNLNEEKVSKE